MLSRIYIKNFALIDVLEVSLKDGLQVITGETGAGKSIILGALRLILGERADLKSISNIDEKSIVETEFELNNQFKNFFVENDLDYEQQTIIRREILPSGKSRAFINDVPVTLEVLKQLTSQLIDIHSQFQTSNLFAPVDTIKLLGVTDQPTEMAARRKLYDEELAQKAEELLAKQNEAAIAESDTATTDEVSTSEG